MKYPASGERLRTRLAILAVGFWCVICIAGCSKRMAGTYVSLQDKNMILELKSNGSFYIRSEQAGYSGKYSINNAELFLKGDAGIAMKFAVRSEDTLVEDTGEVYKRR